MADTIRRYLLNKEVVICAADTKELVNHARTLHQTFPVCTAALGRTLTGAVMMASTGKEKEALLTLNLKGGGPAGTVSVAGRREAYGQSRATIGSKVARSGALSRLSPSLEHFAFEVTQPAPKKSKHTYLSCCFSTSYHSQKSPRIHKNRW